MDARTDPLNAPRPRPSRGRRLIDFADPAVWAWIAVVAMLALPAAATLA